MPTRGPGYGHEPKRGSGAREGLLGLRRRALPLPAGRAGTAARIEAGTRAVRAERDAIEKDQEEHLYKSPLKGDAWKEQLERIHQRDVPAIWRLKTEAQFLLVAVYGILSMARAIRSASAGKLLACVQRALSAFEKAAPDADLLRHIHEHMDAYMRGEWKDRHRLPDPTMEGAVAMLDEGLVYLIGGKLFRLAEIVAAAEELARAVAACTLEKP